MWPGSDRIMKTTIMRTTICILISLLPILCFGQEELNDDRKILKRPQASGAMSEIVYKRLTVVHEQMGEDKLDDAIKGLTRLAGQNLSRYEEALVQQTFGFVYAQQGNEKEAIKRFQESLASEAMPAQAHQRMLYSLAGLLLAEEEYQQSIDAIREWFRYEADPIPDAYMLIGSSFSELQQFQNALPYVLKAIEIADEPRENWYMLALAIHFQDSNFSAAADVLVTMLQFWPDNVRYWEMLSGCYLELEDDKRALDTMMVTYSNGMLTKPVRIRAAAQLNLMRDTPYTAGVILEDAIADGMLEEDEPNLKLLLQSWLSAREYDRAVDVINRLGKFADDGEYFLRAAQIYSETGEWQKVIDNADKALDGGIKNDIDALMLQGSAYSELGKLGDATRIFGEVRTKGDAADRRNADSWIAFISEKRSLHNARID
jgi:tetratricopeptide (TPR) repeat protein